MKITILRRQLQDIRRWWTKNWDDYLKYLEQNDLPMPVEPYGIFINLEKDMDYRFYRGEFEDQVPSIFHLKLGLVEYEIVDA